MQFSNYYDARRWAKNRAIAIRKMGFTFNDTMKQRHKFAQHVIWFQRKGIPLNYCECCLALWNMITKA